MAPHKKGTLPMLRPRRWGAYTLAHFFGALISLASKALDINIGSVLSAINSEIVGETAETDLPLTHSHTITYTLAHSGAGFCLHSCTFLAYTFAQSRKLNLVLLQEVGAFPCVRLREVF